MKWLDEMPTTNVRIGVTLVLTIATAVRYLGWGVPVRMTANIAVLDGWGYWLVFLAAMAGLDVAQYLGKRFSDTGYAAAKNTGPTPAPPAPIVAVSSAPVPVAALAAQVSTATTSDTITGAAANAAMRDVHPTGEASSK